MLEVLEPGLLTTVQDAGRPDAVDMGVPLSGACDPWSLALANRAVGNERGAAAIEMTLLGATFRVIEDCVVAAAGADMGAGTAWPRRVGHAEVLRFGPTEDGTGARTYLALAGGVDVPLVLGSKSTCLVGGFGGLDGRALRAGDVIRAARPAAAVGGSTAAGRATRAPLVRFTSAGENAASSALVARGWRVSGRADRQGLRLEGEPIAGFALATGLSRPVTWGTIQLPPDGLPIVLLADAQTVGGYPVLGVVITADLPVIGQLGPGDSVRFELVGVADAQSALRAYVAELNLLGRGGP